MAFTLYFLRAVSISPVITVDYLLSYLSETMNLFYGVTKSHNVAYYVTIKCFQMVPYWVVSYTVPE